MRQPGWSISRIMADIAFLAVGMTTLLALRSSTDMQDAGLGVLGMFLALILTLVTDRAFFGRKHRAFWVGFAVSGWICSVATTIDPPKPMHVNAAATQPDARIARTAQ
jgi:hypothetical protein